MDDYMEMYYTRPDEMIGASRPKQKHAMEMQFAFFKAKVSQVFGRFSINELYRELSVVIPHNFTVNSLKDLFEVVRNIPPSPQRRASKDCFKRFFKLLEDLRRLAEIFKERIYAVLYEFYYDTSFIRLQDLHVKRGGLVKGQGKGLSPDLVREVGGLCRQLSFNIDGLKDTVNTWQELLQDSEIDPILFDENSAESIRQFKDCKRFQHILRLVPDVLDKIKMSMVLARTWCNKAEEIRQKLAGNHSSDSGLSSSSEMEAPSVASKAANQNRRQQKATNDVPIAQQPSVFRKKKVKSLEDMDMERTSFVKKPPPQADTGNQDRSKKSKSLERSRGNNKNPKPDTFKDREEEKKEEVTPQDQISHPPMGKQQKKDGPRVRNQRGGVPKDESGVEATEDNTRGQNDEDGAAKVTNLPRLEVNRRSKKARDQDSSSKNQRSISQENNENDKMPSIHNDGNDKGRPKAPAQGRSNNAKTFSRMQSEESLQRAAKEVPVSVMGGTEDGMEALSLEKEFESKEQEPRDSGPLSWQEKKLEKLREKLEELIEGKETQQAALKLLTAMKDNLAREISKYRGSYHLKQRLQVRVTLLTDKAHGWQEETKSLDYQHRLLAQDLRLEMKLNGSFYRFNNILKERVAYLNDTVQKERLGMEQLLQELGTLKETTEQMLYYGIPFDPNLDEYEMEFGNMAGYGREYWSEYGYKYGALGGSLRPYKASRFLRDEELLLGRSLQSRYERSIWEALKYESVDSMSLMSPEDSFYFQSRALENAAGGQGEGDRRDPGRGYQGDDDSTPESDAEDDEISNRKKQPQMYDQKRDEKQPPAFVPI